MDNYKFEIGDIVRLKKGQTPQIVIKREMYGEEKNHPSYKLKSTNGKGKTQWASENLICKCEEIQTTLFYEF